MVKQYDGKTRDLMKKLRSERNVKQSGGKKHFERKWSRNGRESRPEDLQGLVT